MEKKNLNKSKKIEKNLQSVRLKEILNILHKYKLSEGLSPIKFRLLLEELGATYIKIGQIMSLRQDILPAEYCDELTHLRKNISPLPFRIIKKILKKEYKRPLEELFSNIEEEPIGSASIAQVHKATLISGEVVVLKVQKPGIYETMAQDIKLLQKALSLLKFTPINSVIDFQGVLDEMWTAAKQELDFLVEAAHIREFASKNKNFKFIKVPKVYDELSTTNCLVLEYADGISIVDKETLLANGYDLNEIALKLADSYILQIIENGFFQADPHPDNFKIQDGKIVFLDFGMMGRLSQRDRKVLEDCMFGIISQDIYKVEKCILTIGSITEEIDHPAFLNDLEIFLDKYSTLDLGNLNLGVALTDLFKITKRYKIRIPKNITMLTRSIIVIEGLLNEIDPSIHLVEVIKNRVSVSFLNKLTDKQTVSNKVKKALLVNETLLELPKESLDLIKMIARGNAKINLEISDSDNKMGKLEKMLNKIILAVIDVALIVSCSLLYTNVTSNFQIDFLRAFCLVFAIFISVILLFLMFRKD